MRRREVLARGLLGAGLPLLAGLRPAHAEVQEVSIARQPSLGHLPLMIMEEQGLLVSEWRIVEEVRPRRYYQLGAEGAHVLERLSAEWESLASALSALLRRDLAERDGKKGDGI